MTNLNAVKETRTQGLSIDDKDTINSIIDRLYLIVDAVMGEYPSNRSRMALAELAKDSAYQLESIIERRQAEVSHV